MFLPGTPGGVLMNFPLKCEMTASHFSVDSILKPKNRVKNNRSDICSNKASGAFLK